MSTAAALADAGAMPVEVRNAEELANVDCLVDPRRRVHHDRQARAGLRTWSSRCASAVSPPGMPVFGTCAGMIVLAERVLGGDPLFAVMDIGVERNAYGRQVESFEADVEVDGIEHPVRGVFIRAPRITDVGDGVRVLAEHEGAPVVLEQGNLLVSSFHPELIGETGLHRYLLAKL